MSSLSIRPEDLHGALEPDGWFGHATSARFAAFAASAPPLPDGEMERFFGARGLRIPAGEGDERELARALIALDLRAIAHGLSLLHSDDTERAALRLLPTPARVPLGSDPPALDHVGLEIFGRLEWYLDALESWAVPGGLRITQHRIFPSVQVRKALTYDPDLGDVRIARVWMRRGERSVNLELFEASQDWHYTAARQLARWRELGRSGAERVFDELGRSLPLPLDPVEHLALRVECWQTVEAVHRILARPAARARSRRLYDEELSYNPKDESLNSKILTSSSSHAGIPIFGHSVEIISYGVRQDPRRREAARSDDAGPRVSPRPA